MKQIFIVGFASISLFLSSVQLRLIQFGFVFTAVADGLLSKLLIISINSNKSQQTDQQQTKIATCRYSLRMIDVCARRK